MTVLTHTRKRRGSAQLRPVSRVVTFGPALVLPVWGWSYLHRPEHWAGLAVMLAVSLWLIPALIVLAVFLLPHTGPGLVPRSWRKRYRGRLVARGVPREQQRSARISEFLRRVTFAADRHKCAYCHRRFDHGYLNVDHYLPWSQGGMTVLWNTMTLCRDCNLTKSNFWRGVFYRPVEGHDNVGLAAAILAAERRHRYSPLRLTRAAWALGA